MDPFRLCLALGPLAIYLSLMGVLNLGRRPFLTSSARDIAAVGIALSGLIIVGPLELFLPHLLAVRFGDYLWLYWLLLISFYFSTLTLLVLSARPRISLYNLSREEARELVANVATNLDPASTWAGDSLVIPALQVQLHLDPFLPLKSVALSPVGPRQSLQGWKRLELALAAALRQTEVAPNPAGVSFLLMGILLFAAILTGWISDPQAVAKAFGEVLGL